MRLFFISALDYSSDSSVGVAAKLDGQASACSKLGHTVFVSRDFGRQTRITRQDDAHDLAFLVQPKGLSRRVKYRFLAKWVRSNPVDAIIVRFDHLDPVFCEFARHMRRIGVTVAVEFPTFPFHQERKSRHEKLLSEGRFLKYATRRVFAGLEALRAKRATRYIDFAITYLACSHIWGCPTAVFDNGIDALSLPLRIPRAKDGYINLLSVAKFSPHHGIDRLLRGLSAYGGPRAVRLTLVGKGPASGAIERLVNELGLESKVRFAGTVVGERLDDLFASADIAVGSLGLHRINISLASTIKSREYCARGIPFVYAFPEKGFSGEEDFTLVLPSDDSPIEVERLIDFYDLAASDSGMPRRMRQYALQNFSWTSEMRGVVSVLEAAVVR